MAAIGALAAAGKGQGEGNFQRRARVDDDLSSSSGESSAEIRVASLKRDKSSSHLSTARDASSASLTVHRDLSSSHQSGSAKPDKRGNSPSLKPGSRTFLEVPTHSRGHSRASSSRSSPHSSSNARDQQSSAASSRSNKRHSRMASELTDEDSMQIPLGNDTKEHLSSTNKEAFEIISDTASHSSGGSTHVTDDSAGQDSSFDELLSDEQEEYLKKNMGWRERMYNFLDDPLYSRGSFIYSLVMFAVIATSTCTFLTGTYPDYTAPLVNSVTGEPEPDKLVPIEIIEYLVITFFTVDYILRIVLVRQNRFLWMVSFMNLIDLIAILPFYLEIALAGSGANIAALVVLRVLRLLRVLRILKLAKNNKQLPIATRAFKASGTGFAMAFFTVIITIIVLASAMYYAELSGAQYDADNQVWLYPDGNEVPFQSIPHTMWFMVVTITTVGYGDMFPITIPGKIVGTLTMMAGVLVLAFPLTILTANFQLEYDKYNIKIALNHSYRRVRMWQRGLDVNGNKIEHTDEMREKYGWLDAIDTTRPEPKLAKDMWRMLMLMRKSMEAAEDRVSEFRDQFHAIEYVLRSLERRVMKRRRYQKGQAKRGAGCWGGRCFGWC